MQSANKNERKTTTKWAAVKRGDGKVTGHIELFWLRNLNRWVTIPGKSGFRAA